VPERDERAPVERHDRLVGDVPAEADADGRDARVAERVEHVAREGAVDRDLQLERSRAAREEVAEPALERCRDDDAEVPLHVCVVRREEDRRLGLRRLEASRELGHAVARRLS